jgi:hypothetical protein
LLPSSPIYRAEDWVINLALLRLKKCKAFLAKVDSDFLRCIPRFFYGYKSYKIPYGNVNLG